MEKKPHWYHGMCVNFFLPVPSIPSTSMFKINANIRLNLLLSILLYYYNYSTIYIFPFLIPSLYLTFSPLYLQSLLTLSYFHLLSSLTPSLPLRHLLCPPLPLHHPLLNHFPSPSIIFFLLTPLSSCSSRSVRKKSIYSLNLNFWRFLFHQCVFLLYIILPFLKIKPFLFLS